MREITDEEIIKAISNLKANKAAGPNGFPLEWYKVIKDLLIPLMKNTYNHDIKTAITPPSLRDAVISLIPKQGKDKMECGSYRPVSILNSDYKIFTHILAKRLKKILPQIVSLVQTGFIQQRHTQDYICRTLHVMEKKKRINFRQYY